MDAGDWVAAYAAVVATAALGWQVVWQVRRHRDAARTAVRLHFDHGASRAESWSVYEPERAPMEYVLSLVVINDGEHTEQVAAMNVSQPSGLGHELHGTEQEPLPLPPRGRIARSFRPQHAGMELSGNFQAFVGLGSGRFVELAPQALEPSSLGMLGDG